MKLLFFVKMEHRNLLNTILSTYVFFNVHLEITQINERID